MQSHNYVPGVSGWKLDKSTGKLEVNSVILGGVDESPARQLVWIEVGDYGDFDLPSNASDLLAFMEAELQKVPAEYRQTAEFEKYDASYADDSANWRTTLTYRRPETEEEAAARIEKSKVAGTKVHITKSGVTIMQDGVVRVRLGNLDEPPAETPFAVSGDQVFINQAYVDDSTITNAKVGPNWSIKLELRNGKYVAAGCGLGADSQFLVSADHFAIKDKPEQSDVGKALGVGDVTDALDMIAGAISETELGRSLLEKINAQDSFVERVRQVLRDELHPGRLLHR